MSPSKNNNARRHYSRRGRVFPHGPAKIVAAVGRHFRHWPPHPAMADLGAGQIAVVCQPADPELGAELDRLGFPAESHRKSRAGTRHVQFHPLCRELDRLEQPNRRLGDCSRRPAASTAGNAATVLEFQAAPPCGGLPAGIRRPCAPPGLAAAAGLRGTEADARQNVENFLETNFVSTGQMSDCGSGTGS